MYTHDCIIAQNYQIGHRQYTFIDSSRANRQIPCEIYYPSNVTGDNVAIANGTFPVLVFGHGFVMPVSAYDIYWNTIVPKGYIIAFPSTESSFSPSHINFGKDMAHISKSMRLRGKTPSSPFYNAIDSTTAVMGHSMGGGCAFLAMQYDPDITALVSFAAAVTNPSSVIAASAIKKPSLVFAASNDCVAPPKNHQIPMYDSLASECKTYIDILGGDHCQFASYNFNCSLGQSTCNPKATVNSSVQQTKLFEILLPWLKYYLKKDCISGTQLQSLITLSNGIMSNQNCSFSIPNPMIQGNSKNCISDNIITYRISNSAHYKTQWSSLKKGIVIGNSTNDSLNVIWNSSGFDTVKVRLIDSLTGCFKDTLLAITIDALPNPIISGKSIACIGSIERYSVPYNSNMMYQWRSVNNGTIQSSLNNNELIITWQREGNDSVSVIQTDKSTGCTKEATFHIEIPELNRTSINGSNSVCINNTNESYSLITLPNFVYTWQEPKNGIIIGSKNGNIVYIRWNKEGVDTIKARITNTQTGCMYDTSLIVTVQEKPSGIIYGNKNICEGTLKSVYTIDAKEGYGYIWSITPSGILLGQSNTDTLFVRWTKIGTEKVSLKIINLTTNCFTDTSITINVNPIPRPVITGKSIVTQGEKDIYYSIRSNQGSMYNWEILSGDAQLFDKDQYQIKVNFGQPGKVLIEALEGNKYDCASADTIEISVMSISSIKDDKTSMYQEPNLTYHTSSILIESNNDLISTDIYSVLGERKSIYFSEDNQRITIPNQYLSKGLYFMRIKTLYHFFTKQLLIE